jgi:26S proteasome non-ATPase regulatory subunit 9
MSSEALFKEKELIEVEIRSLDSWFETSKFGRHGALVDADGFPFPEVEAIIETRQKRNRYSCLQNDHLSVMQRIEALLATQAAPPASSTRTPLTADAVPHSNGATPSIPVAFAIIDAVSPASPASEAGLLVNDRVIRFGRINSSNQLSSQSALISVRDLVASSENRRVSVVVERTVREQPQMIVIALTPNRWGGVGLLGCLLRAL